MIKRLMCFNPDTGQRELVATYTLDGEQVRVDLADPAMARFFSDSIVDDGVELRPRDGQKYFDALERAFSTGSLYSIERA